MRAFYSGAVMVWCACVAHVAGQAAAFQGIAIGFDESQRISQGLPPPLSAGVLDVPPDMRPPLERMWKESPTFRRQCARLVDESVTIVVRLVERRSELGRAAARTLITTRQGRVTSAEARLASAVDLHYLAHEIEHVLEQVDGVDLGAAVAQGLHGVERSRQGRFETARAIAVEAQVRRELGTEGRGR